MVSKTNQKQKIIGWQSPILIHPGEHLADFLEDHNISQAELSERTGISKKAINEIVKGKNPITENTAFCLSKVFSVSPEFWNNLQKNYEIALAHLREKERLKKEAKSYLPELKETYKELKKQEILPPFRWIEENFIDITRHLQHFFAVNSLAYIKENTMNFIFRKDFAFRKYESPSLNHYTLAAWLQLGKIKAQKAEVAVFDSGKLKSKLIYIKSLSLKKWRDYLPELERVFSECGVVLVYAPKMKNAPVQGATKWIDSDKVLLMLNTTNKDEGKFWFNLFHEIGHILLHGKKDPYINLENDSDTQEEKEANDFAEKNLVSDFNQFYKIYKKEKNLKKTIQEFAKKNGVPPAVIAGMLTHKHKKSGNRIYKDMSCFLKEKINYSNIKILESLN